ncbi:HsdM family class I SAM-dependent methyltransferase [Christiangramia forsetii]|uniref:site-specific DNA-methyltransferase (adenine-specific) n=2 Tax=Christiangramia forsetii TaxID=411153 RepID=A0M150_CHRFK|nr:N-6 DNA methylase [Christiangramia forsetii]GGG46225.1 type I endonuclease-methyltransferase fusion protein [Christiangramia forsetii]CAL66345.1 type I restriction-modification system methyltransferase subunit [Christiangramia forsetii KT0803]
MQLSQAFKDGLGSLGLYQESDDCLFLTKDYKNTSDLSMKLQLEKAQKFEATAVFFRNEINRPKAQIYIYDHTHLESSENRLSEIQKMVWSNGAVPIVCVFYKTEIKILDCTQHIKDDNKPVYLATLEHLATAHELYNQNFAIKIKTGTFWEEQDVKKKFKFNASSYDILIRWIREIARQIGFSNSDADERVIKKIIIQAIMIKYLEERKDSDGNSSFNQKYFRKYGNCKEFVDVLSRGSFVALLDDLQHDLNGNLFDWKPQEKELIPSLDLSGLVEALKAYKTPEDSHNEILELIRYYEFSYIPVELISRIYEEFLAGGDDALFSQKEKKQKDGIFYTPSHLAQLLVDEIMPLHQFKDIDIKGFKILDPACGSGIFLVLAFKRLVQWWRLQNDLKKPDIQTLKDILDCIYGIDKEFEATKLAAFSLCLALCDELSPKQIINELKFSDLTDNQILHSDFFIEHLLSLPGGDNDLKKQQSNFKKLKGIKFSRIIGNPPFDRGALNLYKRRWEEEGIDIPQGQIALKFLSECLALLEPNGLQCLIIKSSSLLYNSSSIEYKERLFRNYNVLQILDFTPLGRNNSLWDGADVASAAIFLRNEKPDFGKNILHLIFRRTKAVKERLVFEVDEYDFHFVKRSDAINNPFIWKINLLGGGRIGSLIAKSRALNTFQTYLDSHNCVSMEGYRTGLKGKKRPEYMYSLKSLPTSALKSRDIDFEQLEIISQDVSFVKVPEQFFFESPNVLLYENLGTDNLPVFLNTNRSFSFKANIISVKSLSDDVEVLKSIVNNFEINSDFYLFFIFCTSSQVLINLNSALLKKDYMTLPYVENRKEFFSEIDINIINDVNTSYQSFLRHGEHSEILSKIDDDNLKSKIQLYGSQFCKLLNEIKGDQRKSFRIDEVCKLYGDSYICVVFKYEKSNYDKEIVWRKDNGKSISSLLNFEISSRLNSKRILRYYHSDNTIFLVKPNQKRYWLSHIAYRDADKTIFDLVRKRD